MAQWLLKPADGRRNVQWFQADDLGAERFLARWASKPRAFAYVMEAIGSVWVDGGGSVMMDELKVEWEANGCKFASFLRQVPAILGAFRAAQPNAKVPGCVCFRGWIETYILSEKTRADGAAALRKIMEERGDEIAGLDAEMARRLSGANKEDRDGRR